MKREAKKVIAALEAAGYKFARRNAKTAYVYSRGGSEIAVNPSINEAAARRILAAIGVDFGKGNKRNATAAKAREAKNRERAAAEVSRLEKERARILAEKDVDAQYLRLLDAVDRDLRYWRTLMTETPSPGKNRGRRGARHQSGRVS